MSQRVSAGEQQVGGQQRVSDSLPGDLHKNSVWDIWKGHGAAVPSSSTYMGGGRYTQWFEAAASTTDKYAYARLAATEMHR